MSDISFRFATMVLPAEIPVRVGCPNGPQIKCPQALNIEWPQLLIGCLKQYPSAIKFDQR